MREDALTVYINFARLIVERDRRFYQLMRGQQMPKIEIKGLGATVQRARDAINAARGASTDLETAAGAFAADAVEITEEIKKHHSDLLFEAQTLGNSPPPGNGSDRLGVNRTATEIIEDEKRPATAQVSLRPGADA